MREIEFRVYDSEKKLMFTADLLKDEDFVGSMASKYNYTYPFEHDEMYPSDSIDWLAFSTENKEGDRFIQEQYIGKKAVNGAKVFEGDHVIDAQGCKGTVAYNESSCSFVINDENGRSYSLENDLEIIGNIHLEGEQ